MRKFAHEWKCTDAIFSRLSCCCHLHTHERASEDCTLHWRIKKNIAQFSNRNSCTFLAIKTVFNSFLFRANWVVVTCSLQFGRATQIAKIIHVIRRELGRGKDILTVGKSSSVQVLWTLNRWEKYLSREQQNIWKNSEHQQNCSLEVENKCLTCLWMENFVYISIHFDYSLSHQVITFSKLHHIKNFLEISDTYWYLLNI